MVARYEHSAENDIIISYTLWIYSEDLEHFLDKKSEAFKDLKKCDQEISSQWYINEW